jgi:hypothetical protein
MENAKLALAQSGQWPNGDTKYAIFFVELHLELYKGFILVQILFANEGFASVAGCGPNAVSFTYSTLLVLTLEQEEHIIKNHINKTLIFISSPKEFYLF